MFRPPGPPHGARLQCFAAQNTPLFSTRDRFNARKRNPILFHRLLRLQWSPFRSQPRLLLCPCHLDNWASVGTGNANGCIAMITNDGCFLTVYPPPPPSPSHPPFH